MDDLTNNPNQYSQKTPLDTVVSSITDLFSRTQTYLVDFFTNRNKNNLQKIQAETTRQQWGDDKVFKQGTNASATNIAPKKPEMKKEPILK